MKRRLLLIFIWALGWTIGQAQLPAGTVAPDFTVTDLDGNSHNLYSLLNQGKTVYIDFSATWCGPCWNYHNSHALRDIWEAYGPGGTDEAFVIFIEGDANTNIDCLYGLPSCVGGTQGNWVSGTPYPIADDANVRGLYQVAYYPTIYMVCPGTKKVYETGQLNKTGLWNRRTQFCDLSASVALEEIKDVICFGTNTGKITLSASGGIGPYTYTWSTGTVNTTGVLNNVAAGTYACTVTPANGGTATISGLQVSGPSGPISIQTVETYPAGCNSVPGSALVAASGGWNSGYSYQWNNGQASEELINVPAGTYIVTVTDDGGCTKTSSVTIVQTPPPVVNIAPPPSITCATPTIQINASASSSGSNIEYLWFAAGGGVIVSGGTTATPTVSAAGTYNLRITDTESTCVTFGSTTVTGNTTTPTAEAGIAGAVTCLVPTDTLQGSGSSGAGITYLWTASNGGNILSGANTLTPIVNAPGTYTLKVTNSSNGCSATSTTTVTGVNTQLSVAAAGGALTCISTSVQIGANTPSNDVTYSWTGPNGFASTQQQPTVTTAGTYQVVVSQASSGCVGSASADVVANNNGPGASAAGGAITCAAPTTTISGTSPSAASIYSWTGPNSYSATGAQQSVNQGGTYQLLVTDTLTGCTSTATAQVDLNNLAPASVVAAAANLNCNTSVVQLNGTGSAQGQAFTYLWTTTNGNIISGATTLTPEVNQSGEYQLLVTNTQTGCTNTASATVNQSTVMATSANSTPVLCNGASNGSATAVPTGGNGSYTYSWSNGETTSAANNLSAGTYVVIVTDGEGCTSSASAIVTQPSAVAANAVATAQSAVGVNDGTATASPSGGAGNYTYNWSNGETTAQINNLAPGVYIVTVTDDNSCTAVEAVNVTAFGCTLAATSSTTNVSCFGAADGGATINLVAGNDPVSFIWSNGATTNAIQNVVAGTYTVEVSDADNCLVSFVLTINEPTPLQANPTATPVTATGANDGTATAFPTGGTGNYQFEWSTGATTPSISGLAPGQYTVTVTDENNCTSTASVTVTSFDCAIATVATSVDATCFGISNGSVQVALNGGTAPYTYLWSNGATTPSVNGLPAGSYTVQITDDNGCEASASVEIGQPAALLSSVASIVQPICPTDPTGQVSTTISGGTPGYSYSWSNGSNGQNLSNVPAGDYTLTVLDANGCSSTLSTSIVSTDTEAPSVGASENVLTLDASGIATATVNALQVQASDNCAVNQITFSPATFNCSQIGTQNITITATDASGNSTSFSYAIEVVDEMAPVLTCPASVTYCSYENTVNYAAPTAVDNCLAGGNWAQTAGLPSGSEFPVGSTTQTYEFKDQAGNVGTCSFEVVISAPISVSTSIVNASGTQANGSIDLSVTGGTGPYSYAWTQDGNPFSNLEDLANVSAGFYAVVVTDANGCQFQSAAFEVKAVSSVQEPIWMNGMVLRPNPASDVTQLVFRQFPTETLLIEVVDLAGKVVSSQVAEQAIRVDINVASLPEGAYFIRLRSEQMVGVRKLIVYRK